MVGGQGRPDGFTHALEDQRDKIEEALIAAGVVTRDNVDAHGILGALRKAFDNGDHAED